MLARRSKPGALVAALLLLSFAALSHAGILTFTTSIVSGNIRAAYTWTPPAPNGPLFLNFTSSTNPANYLLFQASPDTQTANGTIVFPGLAPVNASCTSFCVVASAGGTLPAFANDVYITQLYFLNQQGSTSYSPTGTLTTSLYAMPPTIASPVNGTNFSSVVTFRLTYSLAVLSRSANITCTDPNGAITNINLNNPTQNVPVVVNVTTASLALSASIGATASSQVLAWGEGLHTCLFPWTPNLARPIYGIAAATFRVKFSTLPPTVTGPVAGSFYTTSNQARLIYLLPEQPASGSVNITLFPTGAGNVQTFVQDNTWGTQANVSLAGAADGTYTARFCYRDVLNNPPACVEIAAFTIKQNTGAVTLTISPGRKGRQFPITYTMAEVAAAGTAKLTFLSVPSLTTALTLTLDPNTLSVNTNMNAFDLASNSFVQSHTLDSIPDGTYNIILSAQDQYLNPASTATVTSITFRNATLPGFLLEPAAGTVRNTLAIWYQLLDDPSGNPVLTLANNDYTILLTLTTEIPPSVTYLRVTSAAELQQLPVVSFSSNAPGSRPIPDGVYNAFLTYTNGLTGDPAYSTANQSITIDTRSDAAVITAPGANSRTRVLRINYTLAETASSVVVTIADAVTSTPVASFGMLNSFLSAGAQSFVFPSSGILPYTMLSGANTLPDGLYIVTLNVSDSLTNPTNATSAGPVEIRSSTLPPAIYSPVAGPTRDLSFNLGVSDDYPAGAATVTISGFSSNFVSVTSVLTLAGTTAGNKTFTWDGTSDPTVTLPAFVSGWNGVTVPDGPSYTITLTYSDTFGNSPSSAVVTGVFVRTSTPQPAITSPGPFSSSTAPFALTYLLQAMPLANSTYLNFTFKAPVDLAGAQYVGKVYTFVLDPPGASRSTYPKTFSLSWATNANPLLSSGFSALTNLPTGIPDGTYDILIVTRDSLGNSPASSGISSVLLQTATPAPTLFVPATNSRLLSPQSLLFRIPSASTGSATLTVTGFTLSSRYQCQVQMVLPFSTDTLTGLQNATTAFDPLSSTIASKVVSLSPSPCPSTFSALPNGLYSFTLTYRDFLNNAPASATSTGVTLNWKTEPAVVTYPVSGSVYATSGSIPVTVNFTLLSTPRAGSVVVAFTPVPSGNPPTITGSSLQLLINDSLIVVGEPVSFDFSPSQRVSSPYVAQQAPASSTPLTSGAYTLTVTYQDNELVASAASTATVTDLFVSPNTEPPAIFSPLDNSAKGGLIDVLYRIPSTAQQGSIQFNFTSGASITTFNVAGTQFGTFTLSVNKITGEASISPSGQTISSISPPLSPGSLADGVYTISLRYSDVLGNPPATTQRTGITVSTAAKTPIIYSPSAGTLVTSALPLNITFKIPSGAEVSAGSVVVTLTCTVPNTVTACPTSPITLTIADSAVAPNVPVTIVWYTRTDISSVSVVSSASVRTLVDGTYTISVAYQDSLALQAGTSAPVAGVLVDAVTQAPSLFTPNSNDYYGASMVVSYRIPDSTYTSPVLALRSRVASVPSLNITFQADATGKTVFFSWPYQVFPYPEQINATIPANKQLAGGRYDIVLTYTDAYDNPTAVSTIATDVFVDPTGSPIYRASLTVAIDYDSLPSNFASLFIAEVAAALGTTTAQFKVQSVTRSLPANYPVVTFDILPRFGDLPFVSSEVVAALQDQFNNPSSNLRISGTFTSQIQVSAGLAQTQICLNEQQVIIGCPSAPSESSSDNIKWILVGLGAGLAVVVIVLAVLLHWFDQRRKKAESERDSEHKHADEEHNKYEKEHAERMRGEVPLANIPSSASLAAKPDVPARETNVTITLSPSSPSSNTTPTPLVAL